MSEPTSDTFDGLPQQTFEQSWLGALADGLDDKPSRQAIAVPSGGGPPRIVIWLPRNHRNDDPRYPAGPEVDRPGAGVRFFDVTVSYDQENQLWVSNDVANGAT